MNYRYIYHKLTCQKQLSYLGSPIQVLRYPNFWQPPYHPGTTPGAEGAEVSQAILWGEDGSKKHSDPLVNIRKTMENQHFFRGKIMAKNQL